MLSVKIIIMLFSTDGKRADKTKKNKKRPAMGHYSKNTYIMRQWVHVLQEPNQDKWPKFVFSKSVLLILDS